MKAISIVMALVFGLASSTAFACPKGTHLTGGTGAHHKGGKCVAASEEKTAEKVPVAKTSKKQTKSKAKKEAEVTK